VSTILVGIAGGTGSGKTTLARRIVEGLPDGQAWLIAHDDYYRDRSHLTPAERDLLNFDEPDALENDRLAADLAALRAGRAVDAPRYDFTTHTRRADTRRLDPRPVIVVEGILLFAVPALCDLFDVRIFVDTPDDTRLMRRIKRDLVERGRDIASIESQYFGSVRAMHQLHVAPSKRHAHIVIPEESDNPAALDVIVGRLHHQLARLAAP
jgi:uridine kinase